MICIKKSRFPKSSMLVLRSFKIQCKYDETSQIYGTSIMQYFLKLMMDAFSPFIYYIRRSSLGFFHHLQCIQEGAFLVLHEGELT